MENFEGVVSYFWPMVTLGPLPFGRLHGKIIALLGARKYTTPIPYTCTSTPLVVVIAHDIKIDKYTWNDTGSPKLDSPHMCVFIAPKATHPILELIFRTK